ncbi:glucokinase [Scopulibacillus darangshiensis]|uniref:Glucokinase n=1 Tax=Scopulibacillus darangshiensis TaxID=442528 RepID=A0A4R2PAB9_9BACL|nr:ROK family transcriptional regulator [Scopulibacillus darangshiensis]TCP31318.1 glucokinase [Scopulibacillus darangshiensis]
MKKADAAYIKKINRKIVLDCIRENGPVSRSQISNLASISKPTVSCLVDGLLKEGWILEGEAGGSSIHGGRKPIYLRINETAAYIIGVDIGGTKVASGITDLSGKVLTWRWFKTSEPQNGQILNRLQHDVSSMIAELKIPEDKIMGMGIGNPGITDVEKGIVKEAPTLGWVNYPVKAAAEAIFDFPVFVDNDVNAGVLGEQWIGAGRGKRNIIYLAIGTGIGSGIILNGELYRGTNCGAGEIGYMVTDKKDAEHFNPIFKGFGYLESVAGGSFIGKKAGSIFSKDLTGKDVFQLAGKGERAARRIVDQATEHLAFAIVNVAALFDPELVILGGGVAQSLGEWIERIRETVKKYAPNHPEINMTSFGEEAGIIGAVSLFLKEHDSIITF